MNAIFDLNELDEIGESFRHFGYVRVRQAVATEAIHQLREAIDQVMTAASRLPEGLVWYSPAINGGQIIQRISRINQYSDFVHNFGNSHPALLAVTRSIFNVQRVRFADGSEGSDGSVLVIKDPANASVHKDLRWHWDAKFTQHLPINPFVNLGVYLDDAGLELGGLVVLPTSHRLPLFNPSFEETTQLHPGEVCVEAKTGDIVIHSSEIWHCSRAHSVPQKLRRVLYFNFHPVAEGTSVEAMRPALD